MQVLYKITLLLSWFVCISIGLIYEFHYEVTPGAKAHPASSWPEQNSIKLSKSGFTLIMLAHPKCPCTRASLYELQHILEHSHSPVSSYVLFYRPAGVPKGWMRSSLYYKAKSMPRVRAVRDLNGVLASKFRGSVSGQTYLYNSRGELLFSGGITFSRGHEDDNPGEESVLALLAGQKPICRYSPVFGCSIQPGILTPISR